MNDGPGIFEDYLSKFTAKVPIIEFISLLLLTALLAYILEWVYVTCGQSLSSRRRLSSNFVLLAATTMIIITVVKASLALSLGLVGALSIVRFRAAIKEPEELTYLFLTIAIGLIMGAGQWQIGLAGFAITCALILLKYKLRRKSTHESNLLLTISSAGDSKAAMPRIVDLLKQHCSAVELNRLDEDTESLEATFQVEFDDLDALEGCRSALLDMGVRFTLLDNRSLI